MKKTISLLLAFSLLSDCKPHYLFDGPEVQQEVLSKYDLLGDSKYNAEFKQVIDEVNCICKAVLRKRLVVASNFHSGDTTEILLIPFSSIGRQFSSGAYSNISNHFILLNPAYIKEFTVQNTLNGPISFRPVIEIILLHELAHFKEKEHNKAFYSLCTHMEPLYHQLEFDLRLYLTCIDISGKIEAWN